MSNHDRAAALLHRGEVVAAVAEERLDRRKHSEGVLPSPRIESTLPPLRAITSVLTQAGLGFGDLDLIVCGRSLVGCRDDLLAQLPVADSLVVEPPPPSHHLCHAYASFATSPFRTGAILILDEQGHRRGDEYEAVSWFLGHADGRLELLRTFWAGPARLSLGMFYNAVTSMVGLHEGGRPAAGKLMALAGLAKRPPPPQLVAIETDPEGGVCAPLEAVTGCFERLGLPTRSQCPVRDVADLTARFHPVHWSHPLAPLLAAWAQAELGRAIHHTAGALALKTGQDRLCVGGGVALNGPAISRLGRMWEDVHIHPAATDDGNAIGLAAYGWLEVLGGDRRMPPRPFSAHLGPSYGSREVDEAVDHFGIDGWAHCGQESVARAASVLEAGGTVCWFEGRSEWGPRALGARSILALPRPGITDHINCRIKHREPFRPLGVTVTPAQLARLGFADLAPTSLLPYMVAVVGPITNGQSSRPSLRSIMHVDGTVRVHALTGEDLPELRRMLEELDSRGVCDAVVNTSFNGFGEPLVESPHDAVRQFLLIGADLLYLDGVVVGRPAQDEEDETWRDAATTARAETTLDRSSYAVSLALKGLNDGVDRFLASWPDRRGRTGIDSLTPQDRARLALARAVVLDNRSSSEESVQSALDEFLFGWTDADLTRAAAIGRRHGRHDLSALLAVLTGGPEPATTSEPA